MKKFAPVGITVLDRKEKLEQLIISLKENECSKETELFIAVDYPPSEKYVDGYKKVMEYLGNGIEGFKKVNIIYHKYNLGLFDNYMELINTILENNDRFIFMEDDNIVSKEFLEYMNNRLAIYENDEKIQSIAGFLEKEIEEQLIKEEINCDIMANKTLSFAYATWREKHIKLMRNISNNFFYKEAIKKGYLRNLYSITNIMRYVIWAKKEEDIKLFDASVSLYTEITGKYNIYPCRSLSLSTGYDGNGDRIKYNYIEKNRMFVSLPINKSIKSPQIIDFDYIQGKRLHIKYYLIFILIKMIGKTCSVSRIVRGISRLVYIPNRL